MNSSRYAEEGEGEDPAVALLAAAVEELAPRAKPVPPGHELVRDVRAEIHRVPRLGRPDQGESVHHFMIPIKGVLIRKLRTISIKALSCNLNEEWME